MRKTSDVAVDYTVVLQHEFDVSSGGGIIGALSLLSLE